MESNNQPDEVETNKQFDEEEYFTFTFKRQHITIIISLSTFIIGLLVGFLLWGNTSKTNEDLIVDAQNPNPSQISPTQINTGDSQAPESQNAAIEEEIPRYDVPIDDDPALGSPDAPITIIEFSDFECPFCTRFHVEVFGRLIETYGDDILFVYRDFPLTSIHSEAFPAAEAANCAGDQDKYWEYHDKLFVGGPSELNSDTYLRYATELELDITQFQECVQSRKYQAEVQADMDYAINLGVRSTPTFFINGIAIVGSQPFEVFEQVIESELNNQ